jgi:hypothetical protein
MELTYPNSLRVLGAVCGHHRRELIIPKRAEGQPSERRWHARFLPRWTPSPCRVTPLISAHRLESSLKFTAGEGSEQTRQRAVLYIIHPISLTATATLMSVQPRNLTSCSSEDVLQDLVNYGVIILMDDSLSMSNWWDQVCGAWMVMSHHCSS